MIDWIRGDTLGLEIPAHSGALQAGGESFLTRAFRATGALSTDNRVARITRFEECPGGSTGSKLFLSVAYEKPAPDLHTDLFVKFSRDFKDDIRDGARFQMEREVQFALLSRSPDFPIAVPTCYYADFHHGTGTGIQITRMVPFGRNGIEPLYEKCLDYRMPDPMLHYEALITALARLAGTHKAGKLPAVVEQQFLFDASTQSVSRRAPYSPQQIRNRVERYADFAVNYPQLLPENIRTMEFIERLADQAPRFMSHVPAVTEILGGATEFIALCHWNANVDNAWFWRRPGCDLECGLMDWGNVSQMNIAMALWGCMSAAETDIWNNHFEKLLDLFQHEFRQSGGPALDIAKLKRHMLLYAGSMGLTWLLDAPAYIRKLVPDLPDTADRFDPRIRDNETARAQLQFLTVFLNLWETQDMASVLGLLEAHSS